MTFLIALILFFSFRHNSNITNDQYLSQAWQFEGIGEDNCWNSANKNTEIVVAVLDTGLDTTQPDLSGRIIEGYDYVTNTKNMVDTQGHGTMMSTCIAAIPNNNIGFVGSAGNINIKIAPFRVGDNVNSLKYVVPAIYDAANRPDIDIINMSFGSNVDDQEIRNAIEYAVNNGKIVVAAAGNHREKDKNEFDPYYYPASYQGVISVGATDRNNNIASFSQINDAVDVYAPGVDVITGYPGGDFGWKSGTSFSAAITTGVVAMLLAEDPSLTSNQMCDLLKSTGISITDKNGYSYTIIQADKALLKLKKEGK